MHSKPVDWILDGLKGVFVLILVATIGPKLFPDVFDKLNWSTSQSTVSLSIFVPGGYTVRANPPGVTCSPVSATNCTLIPTGSARVCLVEPGYPGMPWDWCRG